MKEFKITSNLIDSQTIGENSGIGARSVFEGTVRDTNDGHDVTKLEYECYEPLAMKEGNKILAEAIEKFGLIDAKTLDGSSPSFIEKISSSNPIRSLSFAK